MKSIFIEKIYYIGIIFLFPGCIEKYKRTTKVCNNILSMEVYNVNPAGVDAAYLTDSVNFRIYLGKFDNEHENFNCYCEGDTVFVRKLSYADTSAQVVSKIIYSLGDLKKSKSLH